jgi:hypothetical protein
MNVEDLTLGEVEEVENYAGLPLASLADDNAPKGKLMVALAWIMKRKQEPSFTLHQAKQMTSKELNDLLGADDPKVK